MDVKICAPTGRAAVQIGGTTTYSYMGWSPAFIQKGIAALREITFKNKTTRKRIRRTEVLIIDEVSMISSDFLNCMNECLKYVRADKRHLPFGGIQVIVTGDFCQLAPVKPFQYCYFCGAQMKYNKAEGMHSCPKSRDHGPWADEDKWAFRSRAWAEANFTCFNLRDIHRQNDPTFIKILQKCRLGIPFTENDIDLLMNHDCEVENAPQLLCTREEVDPINRTKFQAITEYKPKRYTVLEGFDWNGILKWEDAKYSTTSEDGTLAAHKEHQLDPVVDLKETMQVMLQVNLDIRAGLVNGSQGVICGWERIDMAILPYYRHSKASTQPTEKASSEPSLQNTYSFIPIREIMSGHACASATDVPVQSIPGV
ncbi:ATP-dependent DNA helicase pfh1 [Fusarium oxysporum f. sp. raphani]|uniref:ATP-dependent DNA helicase n=1 Tax=Fusarium oxysporum f. sp. raphani TaxID=96318 RepID=A0A8J5UHV6_FUSOX|nr:ATP-dependent DNA helicase pfh1 [Fusarium oxysporum f. sp. raphani]